MDHDDEDNWTCGNIPEFGAIFMSNTQTKKECFSRKIFALPSSHTEFVTHVKAGMVLFLFESEKRQLFGVYQATSDGAVDIIPHAFNSLRQRFPAQVRFRQIWDCDPLSEKEFRGAIRENYFSAYKFNFGLSEDQVRRLMNLFTLRKVINKIPPQPRSEAIVEAAVRDKRRVGDDRHGLSERGYMAPAEYDEINGVALHDHRVSSLARGEEDDVLGDDRVNAEGKEYHFPQDDFLAKRRRIGKEGRLTDNNNASENGLYNHGYRRTFSTDTPKNSLDEVRRLVSVDRLSTVQMVNGNQVNEMYNPIQSSEHSLDVRALGDYTLMQRRSRLLDDCNMYNGRQQAFASDYYGNSVGQDKYSVNDDSLLLDDSVKTDCNIDVAISMANSDYNLNLCREARKIKEDQEWLMKRELENGRLLDCDGSTISSFDPSESPFHKKRKTTAAGFQIDENEPDFGTCSLEGFFSSENVLHQLQSGHRIIEGMNYPIVEGRSTENMSEKVPPVLATNAGYTANVDRSTVDNGRFRQMERLGNQESSHTHSNPVISMKYPCYSKLEQNLSSLSDKLVPEKQLSQFTSSHNFNLSRSAFDDATITRAVPYLPDHPNLSHGCTASVEANQDSTRMQSNHLHGSLRDFYPVSSNRPQQYYLESEKSSRPLDTTLGFGNKGFASSTSGLRSSLLQESSDSFVNPNFFSDMNLNTSAPDNYRGLLPSKISSTHTGLEKYEGKKGLLAYYSKSRDQHHAFDGNLHEASEKQSKHAPQHGMVRAAKDFSSKSKFQPETDLKVYENQHFRFSSNKSLKEANKFSEANTTFNRRSVFTRLSSKESSQFVEDKESSQFDEERNDLDFNPVDCYMDSTADEIMQMLQQEDNLSLIKVRKSRVVGQPRESVVSEKKVQSQVETDHSTEEKKYLKNASQATADCMDEIPKETRTFDFKRRSDKKKNLVRIGADLASPSKTTGANEEVKSSTNSTLRRKRLVRPVFGKTATVTATFASHGNETIQIPAPILDKDDKHDCQTASIPGSSNVLVLHTRHDLDLNKEPLYPEEQKDVVAHVLPSASDDLKGHEQALGEDLQIGCSNVLKETSQQKGHKQAYDDDLYICCSNVLKETSMQKRHDQARDDLNIGNSNVLKDTSLKNGHERANDDLHIGSSNVLKETSMQKGHEQASSDDLHIDSSNALKETSMQQGHEQANDGDLHIGSSFFLKETSMQKGHEQASSDDLHIGSSNALKETSMQQGHGQANDGDLHIGSSNVLKETSMQEGHEHASSDDLHIGSSNALKETSMQQGHGQENDGDLHICSSNVLKETSMQKGHEHASTDDLRIGSSNALKETSMQQGHEQANDGDLHVGSSNVLKETYMQKGHEQASSDHLHIGSSNALKETSMQQGHDQPNDDDLHIGSSNVPKETSIQKGHEQASDDDLHIGSSNVLKETSQQQENDGDLYIGSSNVLIETSMQKGHEQASSDDLPIGSSNVLKETSLQKGHEQANDGDDIHIGSSNVLKDTSLQKGDEHASDDDLHIGSSNVLKEISMQEGHEQANDEDLHILNSNVLKETSKQKSLDIQTSVAGVLAKDTDTTIIDLNLPESSLEGFKLGAGCGNNLIKEKHLRKMKIILSTKTDVNASSQ